MRRSGYLIGGILLSLVIFVTGCDWIQGLFTGGKKTPRVSVRGTVLAQIDGDVITLEEFNQRIEALKNLPQPIIVESLDDKKVMLNDMINQRLLAQEALRRRLDQKEDARRAIEESRRNILYSQLILEETKDITVESKEIEDYFNRFKEQFRQPQEIRLRQIVVDSQNEAKQILIRLLQEEDFAALARERSRDTATAKKGGDLGYITPGKLPPELDTIAFSLKKGGLSNVISGPKGYYIIKVEDIREGKQSSLSENWDDIKAGLLYLKQNQKIQGLVNQLRQKSKVVIKQNLLE